GDQRAEDQGSALLSHPVLAELYPPEKRIVLPDRLTVCGGPTLPAAFDWLGAEGKRGAGLRLPCAPSITAGCWRSRVSPTPASATWSGSACPTRSRQWGRSSTGSTGGSTGRG